ncbi:hypothetical protein FACS1894219_04780 [Clostridia bacterium]|nr:hypothetical protein FACS1894219_04780 [Clostridia bacterium]
MTDKELLEQEWKGGTMLNPFLLIDRLIGTNKNNETINKACLEVAELFVKCTEYRSSSYEEIRDCVKEFMTAVFIYLYCEAPNDEQNLNMICELVRADNPHEDSHQSDLDRLFKLLDDKEPKHIAKTHYKTYIRNSGNRKSVLDSLSKRLYPLFSFQSGDDECIFENCGKDEIFEMGISLLHNCGEAPEPCNSLEKSGDEIAYMAAALYLMYDTLREDEQTSGTLYKLLKEPSILDENIKNSNPGSAIASKYWSICRGNILKGKYDKKRMHGTEKFFGEFK